jgi:hypothetical protein
MDANSKGSRVGEVEVGGETYELRESTERHFEAIRVADRAPVGSFTSAPGEMWRLESESPELMHQIVHEAMVAGLLESPPSD